MATAFDDLVPAKPKTSFTDLIPKQVDEHVIQREGMLLGGGSEAPSFLDLVKETATQPFVELTKPEVSADDSSLTKFGKGLAQTAVDAAEGLESPLGVSVIAASALPVIGPVIGRTAAAGFGIKSSLEGFKEAAQAYQEHDWQKAGHALGNFLLGGVMVRGSVSTPKPSAVTESAKEAGLPGAAKAVEEIPTMTMAEPEIATVKTFEEPPVPEGMKRLYRGETGDPAKPSLASIEPPEMRGRWFTPDRNYALYYGTTSTPRGIIAKPNSKLLYVDVPEGTDLGQFTPPKTIGFDPGKEFVLSPEIASQAKEATRVKPAATTPSPRIQESAGQPLYPTLEAYNKALSESGLPAETEQQWKAHIETQLERFVEKPVQPLVRQILDRGDTPISSNAYGPGERGVEFVTPEGKKGFEPLAVVESPVEVLPLELPQLEKPGPGAASPADFTPSQPFLTGIKNAMVDQERSARGLEPMMETARQSNPASWDKAMKLIDDMPGIQDSLIRILNSGDKVPGIEPVVQEALLLHRRVDLRNEFEKTARDLVEAVEQGDSDRITQTRMAHARFEDMLDELESASKKSGTELGRGLQFRRQLATQDFSLAGMISEARAARGGRRLTDSELAEVERLHNELNSLQQEFDAYRAAQKAALDKEVAAGKAQPPPSGEPPLDPTALDKLSEVKQRQKQFKEHNDAAKEEITRTPFDKVLDAWTRWRRFAILSGARSLAKLASYSLQKVVGTPIEEGVQMAISKLPGVSRIAEKAPALGTNLGRELDSFKSGMTTGIRDAVQTFRTGNSRLDALYGEKLQMDPEWTGFFGRLHGAEKSPLKRIAFERSLAQRTDWAAKNGIDVTDPAVQMRLGTEAYTDALSEILMNKNEVAASVNAFIGRLEGMGIPGKIAATTTRTLLPIQRVPLNFVARTWDYIAGLQLGSIKAARALLSEKGIEELQPAEANLIMRQLAEGSIGTAAVLTGFLLPENFGGSFRPGVPREEDDVKALNVRLGEHDVPAYLVHNPLVYAMQFGATLRRVADSKLRKKDEDPQGIPPAIMAAMFGLAEETPYMREMTEISKLGEERTAGPAAGKLLKSLTIPLGVQWAAEQLDKDKPFSFEEEPIPRQPENIWETVETGIPGLRGNVAEKLEKPKKRK